MPSQRDIKKRITSVQSTKQITRTMEMVATAKIRHSTERIQSALPYSKAMLDALDGVVKRSGSIENSFILRHEAKKVAVAVVIASDRGLAGGFNSNIFREVEKYHAKNTSENVETKVICCGKKASSYFSYRKIKPLLEFKDLSADPTMSEAREISSYLRSSYEAGDIDAVVIFYNHARNSADQDLRTDPVLPINPAIMLSLYYGRFQEYDREDLADLSAGERIAKVEAEEIAENDVDIADEIITSVEFEPDAETVLDALLPAYVDSVIYHALIDSAAAEQGARRKAMKSATDNASDMERTLQRLYNRVRQGAITTEITEIVGGAAALEEQ